MRTAQDLAWRARFLASFLVIVVLDSCILVPGPEIAPTGVVAQEEFAVSGLGHATTEVDAFVVFMQRRHVRSASEVW